MENFIEKPADNNPPAFLESEEAWKEKIKKTEELYEYDSIGVILSKEEDSKIENELTFKDVPAGLKALYAETAGRLALGMMNHSYEGLATEDKARGELVSFSHKISGQDLDLKSFVRMISLHLAREADSNTYGASDRTFKSIIEEAANKAANENSPEVHDGLTNPFHLENGTEIFKLNKETGELESFSIEVLLEKGAGVVVSGLGADDTEDIIDFNQKLSKGEYMKKDGENIFGSLEYTKHKLNIDKLFPGNVIKIDVSHPFDKTQTRFDEVTVVSTNQAELEEKYGNAYLSFLGYASKNKIVFKASLKSSSGKIFEVTDISSLKIVE